MKKLLITMVALMACSTATFAQWYKDKMVNGLIQITENKTFQQKWYEGSCKIVKFDQGGSSEKITMPVEIREMRNYTLVPVETIGSYTVYVDCPSNTLVFTNNTSKRLVIDAGTQVGNKGEQNSVGAYPGQTVKFPLHNNYRGKKATFYKCRLNECDGYKRENNSQVLNQR